MGAQATNQDAQNRRNTWFQLMGQPLQTAQITGANLMPGTSSAAEFTKRKKQLDDIKGRFSGFGFDD